MVGNEQFVLVKERGWRRGLGNLTRGVVSDWLGRRRLISSSLAWIGLIDGLLLLIAVQMRGTPEAPELINLYTIFGGVFVSVGVIITMQHAIVGEITSGTAAWVMSKPVSRHAFVLAKALGNFVGLLVPAILVPGLIAYFVLSVVGFGLWLNPLWFIAALSVLTVNVVFWLTLTLMLGAYLGKPAGVIAIPLALLFFQQFLFSLSPELAHVLPWILTSPIYEAYPSVAGQLIRGQAPVSWLPVATALVASALFLALGLRRFGHQDL